MQDVVQMSCLIDIVLVDSQKDNVEMDYDKLADAITERTKVIVPVDIAGICADVD